MVWSCCAPFMVSFRRSIHHSCIHDHDEHPFIMNHHHHFPIWKKVTLIHITHQKGGLYFFLKVLHASKRSEFIASAACETPPHILNFFLHVCKTFAWKAAFLVLSISMYKARISDMNEDGNNRCALATLPWSLQSQEPLPRRRKNERKRPLATWVFDSRNSNSSDFGRIMNPPATRERAESQSHGSSACFWF